MTASRSPELVEVLRMALDSRLQEVHTALPGRIETYDAVNQLANVKPLLKRTVQADTGEDIIEELPVITNVPVAFPRSAQFKLTFPIVPGDYVLLVFNERSIDQFIEKGDDTDPVDFRMHQLADAVAYPGFYPKTRKLQQADTTDMVVGQDGGTAVIHFNPDGTISFTAKVASDAMALASLVKAEIDALRSTIASVVAVPNDGGAAIIAACAGHTVGDVKSDLIKAD